MVMHDDDLNETEMSTDETEEIVKGLMGLHSMEIDLGSVEELDSSKRDGVERIKSGFLEMLIYALEEEFGLRKNVNRMEFDLGSVEELDSSKTDAVERIKSGFIHFKKNNYEKNPTLYNALAKRQNPKFLVFACADSRVCPSHILNFQPGEAFIVRNMANMVPPYCKTKHSNVGAGLEYPITVLSVEHVLVIGHSCCGGIKGLMAMEDDTTPTKTEFIDNWIQICAPARNKIKQECKDLCYEYQCNNCEKEAVNVSLRNLLSYPFVRERVEKNMLSLLGAHYDFVKGTFELWELDYKTTPVFALS